MRRVVDGGWVVIWFVDGLFILPWKNTKLSPTAGPLALWIFNNYAMDSTNLETARTSGPSAPFWP